VRVPCSPRAIGLARRIDVENDPGNLLPIGYDEQHSSIFGILDAEARSDWQEVARIVLHIDPAREPDRARRAWTRT